MPFPTQIIACVLRSGFLRRPLEKWLLCRMQRFRTTDKTLVPSTSTIRRKDRARYQARAGKEASKDHGSAASGTWHFKSDGKLLDRLVPNLMGINPSGAWGTCFTQCLSTKYFRARWRHCRLCICWWMGGEEVTLWSLNMVTPLAPLLPTFIHFGGKMLHIKFTSYVIAPLSCTKLLST